MIDVQLPNGLIVQDASRVGCLAIYEEIFEHECYRAHGISIKNGDTILDLGANIGMFGIWLNTFLKNAKVHALEPAPDTYKMLLTNLIRYDRLGVQLHRVGISDKSGERLLRCHPSLTQVASAEDTAARDAANVEYTVKRIQRWVPLPAWCVRRFARRIMRWYMRGVKHVLCQFVSWSDLVAELELKQVDLVKMDIEGSELAVLRSMLPCLNVKQLVVEVHDPAHLPEIIEKLTAAGYKVTHNASPLMPVISLVYARRQ